MLRRVESEYRIEPIQDNIRKAALVNVPSNQQGTRTGSRCAREHARASCVTIACFEICTGHLPRRSHYLTLLPGSSQILILHLTDKPLYLAFQLSISEIGVADSSSSFTKKRPSLETEYWCLGTD